MVGQFDGRHGGQLAVWVNQSSRRRTRRLGAATEERQGLRFAFYGRTSTEDYQDAASSRCWQREAAENVIAGRGVIVAEYFDTGYSRRLPWAARPGAAALLAAVRDPERGFDAIVLGEFERAFYGHQLQQLLPMFERYGVSGVAAGNRRSCRRHRYGSSGVDASARCAVPAGGIAFAASGAGGDAGTGV